MKGQISRSVAQSEASSSAGQEPAPYDASLTQAQDLFARGQYGAAIAAFQALAENHPDRVEDGKPSLLDWNFVAQSQRVRLGEANLEELCAKQADNPWPKVSRPSCADCFAQRTVRASSQPASRSRAPISNDDAGRYGSGRTEAHREGLVIFYISLTLIQDRC